MAPSSQLMLGALLAVRMLRFSGASGDSGAFELPLGVLGQFTPTGPALMIAVIAADLDLRKNWDSSLASRYGPPIVHIPGGLHPNLTAITLRGGTTSGKQDVGVATALDMMWGLDGEMPVIGLIGATFSSVSMPIATVSAVQEVPQVSFSATSAALSNKDAYPFFLRTAPPDSLQARAFWSWIVYYDVVAACLYTADGYGQGLYDALQHIARGEDQEDRVQGQALRYMKDFVKEEALAAVRQAKKLGSRFVVLFLLWNMARDVLGLLEDEGMFSGGWQIVGSDTCADHIIEMKGPRGFMMFRASGKGHLFPDFEQLWMKLEAEDDIEAEFRSRYKLDNMREPLDHGEIDGLNRTGLGLNAYFAFAFDAFYVFVIAINQLLHAKKAIGEIGGELLLEEMRRVRFTGTSGEVGFDENGDRLAAYELLNMQEGEAALVASFSASTQTFTFQAPLLWMDGSMLSRPPPHLYSCDAGFYQDESRQCRLCPKGKMCLGGPGGVAVACPRGAFANETGATNCTLCREGSFAADVGADHCVPCLPGYEAPVAGMEACTRCESGNYMPFAGSPQCLPCGKNQITNESGALLESECLCPEGSFMCPESGCLPCPEGLHCPKGLDPPLQQGGFWVAEAVSNVSHSCDFSVFRCRDRLECPHGPMGACASGREGRACNNCKISHFPESGPCQPCERSDALPGVLVLILVLVILYLLSISNPDPNHVRLNSLTAASITSQLIMSIQALSSIRELSIQWQEPVKTALDLTKVMTFDVRILRITCIYGTDSPLLHFASQLLACPAACTFLLLAWLLSKMAGRPRSFNAVVHKCGVLVFAFFLSITRSTLIPFQCSPSPNGSTSMVTDPGIICYESNEHTALIALAVAGILTQSAAFLAWATFITMMYPSHVASGRGIVFANRYRFFFNRFKPEKYYYGLVLVYRSAFVALLPIVLVGLPELQVPVMGGILLLVNDLQAHMWPWRTSSANLVDLILTAFLVLVLLGAGPLLVLDSEQSVSVLGWLLCIPVFGTLIVAVVGLARAVVKDLLQRQKRLFGVYLCHHKGGSGSLCRLIKILIAKHSSTRVFLDSDNLENLDYLFDIVRTSTSSVVVVMTPELPKRIWCAGEIVTAWKNRITTVPLICEGFEPLSDESQQLIPTLWTPQEKQNLANLGVQVKDVSAAYVWLQHELTPVKMPRFGQVSGREEAVVEMLKLCGLTTSGIGSLASWSMPVQPGRARILVASSVGDAESLSACEVFKELLQAQMQVECAVVQTPQQTTTLRPWAYYLVVLLFRGLFRNSGFAQILLNACSPGHRSLEIVSVIADTHFDFPPLHTLSSDMQAMIQAADQEARLQALFKEVLSNVVLPFSSLASEGLQKQQVMEIAHRLHRYQDPLAAASQDEEADRWIPEEPAHVLHDPEPDLGKLLPEAGEDKRRAVKSSL